MHHARTRFARTFHILLRLLGCGLAREPELGGKADVLLDGQRAVDRVVLRHEADALAVAQDPVFLPMSKPREYFRSFVRSFDCLLVGKTKQTTLLLLPKKNVEKQKMHGWENGAIVCYLPVY